ncbi:MAG: N-6 DNA methylase, partial [Candidatus Acidiferrales bacterium]
MSFIQAVARFTSLVEKVAMGTTARSENDLSSNLAALLKSLGLATVIDTSVTATGRKRPDILAYVSPEDADLVLPAEIVFEAKRPEEVTNFSDLSEAMASGWIWEEKTLPYVRGNIARIHYFVLTTFVDFAILPITADLRREFVAVLGGKDDAALRKQVQNRAVLFQLAPPLPPVDSRSLTSWQQWIATHFLPQALQPASISDIHNVLAIRTRTDLENFATRLAEFAAGASDDRLANAGLYHSIRASIPSDYDSLDPLTKRDLHLFLMTQHAGMSLSGVEALAREKPTEVVTEFVAASIHSFIGRMFAFKAIEDIFCIREPVPLIPKDHWVFCTTRYNGKEPEQIRTEVFAALRQFKESAPPAIRRFAVYGFFFDWIERFVDAILFRSLLEMFASHDFDAVEGDLLGRFFEIYAQKINRTKRKALGQYYTPQPVVDMVWFLALRIAEERNAVRDLNVLDPGMGSGTFLTQGARLLAGFGIDRFWERLTGFDISAQVLGIAYVNLYIAILSQLDRKTAELVGDLRVYATDALDPRNGQFLRQILPLIPDEDYKAFIEQRISLSAEVKRTGSFTLVIGNPPYKNNSTLVLSQVAAIFPALLESSVREARAQ